MDKYLLNLVISVCLLLLNSCNNDDRPPVENQEVLEALEIPQEKINFNSFGGTIQENPIVGTIIGVISKNRSVQNINYKIDSQEPEGAVAINKKTGELSVLDTSKFDFEAFKEIKGFITIEVEDEVNMISFLVRIQNTLDPIISVPEFVDLFALENSVPETEIGIVGATTTEGTILYSIASQSVPNALDIESDTGIIVVKNSNAFDLSKVSEITAEVVISVGEFSKIVPFSVEVIGVLEPVSKGFTVEELTNLLLPCTWEITFGDNIIAFQPEGNITLNFSLHGPALWKVENTSAGARLFVKFGNGDNYDVYDIKEIDPETIEIVFIEKVGERVSIDFNYFGLNSVWKKVCL